MSTLVDVRIMSPQLATLFGEVVLNLLASLHVGLHEFVSDVLVLRRVLPDKDWLHAELVKPRQVIDAARLSFALWLDLLRVDPESIIIAVGADVVGIFLVVEHALAVGHGRGQWGSIRVIDAAAVAGV